ncbi:MAG: UvrD-helicase domain-containing protein, partial [Acidimicrobiia bacterium]|nr:UvrD-helicase domain-containing protein [Acidimicrobiia bacterium]
MTALAPDEAARELVRSDLASTLFVEAGAGSGKTTALVDRVVELVGRGEAELKSIAAITFTEKAGAELRDRLRQELNKQSTEAGKGSFAAVLFEKAIGQLDGAAIGTLHSFAQRILMENPVEAGLPPRLEVLDEVSSDVAFERRWQAFRDVLLSDPDLERSILLLLATGVKPEALRVLAETFEDNWDLVRDHVPPSAPEPPSVGHLFRVALSSIDDVCARTSECDGWDSLCERLEELAAFAERLRGCADEVDLVEQAKQDAPSFKASNCGQAPNWQDKKSVVADIRLVGERIDEVIDIVGQAAVRHIASVMRAFTMQAAGERRVSGELAFHDLLVLARSLLRDPEHGPAVRSGLHDRYRRLLLDEFQDTDPIQVELAVRIAAADPRSDAAGTGSWDEVELAPGHLFFVGDPKQSIYRFRRADITMFMAARERFGSVGGQLVQLTANFRSCGPVIDWVNDTFGELIGDGDPAGGVASQPPYVGLDAVRDVPPVGPCVSVVGRQVLDGLNADGVRELEAAAVAQTVARVIDEGWSVGDGDDGWREAKLGDITILVPTRMSLPFLESALRTAGIAYRAESSSLVYVTQAVRDLLMTLRAVDDPTDHLRIVSALRTPLFACGDDDLFRFKRERGGHWGFTSDQPETVPVDDPVRIGLEYLRSLHDVRQWTPPSELLELIARDRRAFEIGFAEGRPRDVWRRLRFVIDQAREWSESTGGSLRQYLDWVERQSHEGARVAEAVLPETDDDAVRIMTIHAAKGLQFPVTIVSGMSTGASSRRAAAEVVFREGHEPGYRFGNKVVTDEFVEWIPIDEQMSAHERIRLLYVACTRAQDHLVVSLHRKARKSEPAADKRTNAELRVAGMA